MSQRSAKMESLIQQSVATSLTELLDADAAAVTVTRVDTPPDMRNATVWIGLLGESEVADKLWLRIEGAQKILQTNLSARLTTKFVPKLHLKRDSGGEYAAEIDRLLRSL